MAKTTSKEMRKTVIYSIFVRNFTEEGTFEAARKEIGRIKELGADVIWLMPIHPIGVKERKGVMGSPYAIQDYRKINPEFGTMEDFQRLVDTIHENGMKVIIDVVYNHTSPDSWLSENHPEWFYHKPDGTFGNRVGDWTDIIDLDYSNKELWDYQIETLKMWAQYVDGFRCDVASMVPAEFWVRAREEVETVREGCIWLAESVDNGFIRSNRAKQVGSWSDSEIFQAFDLSYEYDVYEWYRGYLTGQNTLAEYAEHLNLQESVFPDNYVKLRFLENHDQPRIHFYAPDETALLNWTAFLFFQKGATMIYNGQEKASRKTPQLFDKDTVRWTGNGKDGADLDLTDRLKTLIKVKKEVIPVDSTYHVQALQHDILAAVHTENVPFRSEIKGKTVLGIFSLRGETGVVVLRDLITGDFRNVGDLVPDGIYKNLADGTELEVYMGMVSVEGKPIIIEG